MVVVSYQITQVGAVVVIAGSLPALQPCLYPRVMHRRAHLFAVYNLLGVEIRTTAVEVVNALAYDARQQLVLLNGGAHLLRVKVVTHAPHGHVVAAHVHAGALIHVAAVKITVITLTHILTGLKPLNFVHDHSMPPTGVKTCGNRPVVFRRFHISYHLTRNQTSPNLT